MQMVHCDSFLTCTVEIFLHNYILSKNLKNYNRDRKNLQHTAFCLRPDSRQTGPVIGKAI